MIEALKTYLAEHHNRAFMLFRHYLELGKPFLLRSDLCDHYQKFFGNEEMDSPLARVIRVAQEAALQAPWIYLAVRPYMGRWKYLRIHVESHELAEIPVSEFLSFKEDLRGNGSHSRQAARTLEIDLAPFERGFPKLQEARSIGSGVKFLNRRLSSQLFQELGKGDKHLLHFLSVHQCHGTQLMLNNRIKDVAELRKGLRRADEFLDHQDPESKWADIGNSLQVMGFEPGWGRTVIRMLETMRLLSEILEAPEPGILESFLSRIPMIFNLAIISPHGYFGQDNVLGRPDTGGQIVYILDQVRALEHEMRQRLFEQGLDIEPQIVVITRLIPEADGTTCDRRLEKIRGTKCARILRIPFRDADGKVIPQWISRFQIWPYLERFSIEMERELIAELGRRPDLIIGNYSDGNLVASILSQRLQVTQCNIAHALEKSKYLLSDLYWPEMESEYHFSCQFTADLIAMNTADFIITSTYQEIAGTRESVGQYESYQAFTMPGLYRVVNGIDVFDPKFNIVSPGADPEIYFPYHAQQQRLNCLHDELQSMIYGEAGANMRGSLSAEGKPLLFSMARLDRIKNMAGLVEWYARSPALREEVNLLIIAGHVNADHSSDSEEQAEIRRMHTLMDEYNLDGQVRWLGMHLEKPLAGELYRFVADGGGAFVQPALFESFGLTIIEAMSSGLPTFATCYGGPIEIIEDGISGFHIDPNHGERSAEIIASFFARCREDPDYWQKISEGGLDRVKNRYTWALYAERMMTLSRIYGFWKFVTNLERSETRRYLEMFYALQYCRLAESVPH